MSRYLFGIALIALASASCSASAQTFSGGLDVAATVPYSVYFTCTGIPTCSGTYSASLARSGCSNTFVLVDAFSITGLVSDRTQYAETTQGTITFHNLDFNVTRNGDGSCSFRGIRDLRGSYTTDPSTHRYVAAFVDIDGNNLQAREVGSSGGSGGAAGPEITHADVSVLSVSIDGTSSNASARVFFLQRDVGTLSNVYVFAFAPRSMTKSVFDEIAKDGQDTCVLAQLNPATNQLIAVSAANLQPYLTGTLSAQGQAVTVLANTPTQQVAGASFFVGYGTTSSGMISGGANQGVVTVPGSNPCPDIFPALPGPVSGLWWNSSESGWGIHFTQRRDIVFAALYTYDDSGGPKWYVAANCTLTSAAILPSTCEGALYEVSGPIFFGAQFNPSLVRVTNVGNLSVVFQNADFASMTYTVAGRTRTVPITRQPLASGVTQPSINYTDLWWNGPLQSGWGLAVTQQYNTIFAAWYIYDSAGAPVWYVASCNIRGSNSCSGTLYRTTGPAFGSTFDSSRVAAFAAGTMSLEFSSANGGSLTYTANGETRKIFIVRQVF